MLYSSLWITQAMSGDFCLSKNNSEKVSDLQKSCKKNTKNCHILLARVSQLVTLFHVCSIACPCVRTFFTNTWCIVGWPKSPLSFFCTINTFFIFTNNFIDLDILTMSALSCYWLLVRRGQGCCQTSPNA